MPGVASQPHHLLPSWVTLGLNFSELLFAIQNNNTTSTNCFEAYLGKKTFKLFKALGTAPGMKHLIIAVVITGHAEDRPTCSPRTLVTPLLPTVTQACTSVRPSLSPGSVLSCHSRPLSLFCSPHSWDHRLSSIP